MTDKMREDFESSLRKQHGVGKDSFWFEKNHSGSYCTEWVNDQWLGWQAACASKDVEQHSELKQIHAILMCLAERPPVQDDDTYTVRGVALNVGLGGVLGDEDGNMV